MRKRIVVSTVLILLLQGFSRAGDQPVPQLRSADLVKTPFVLGSLKVTITNLPVYHWIVLTRFPLLGLDIQNPSSAFATFSPRSLMFVGSDGRQMYIKGEPQGGRDDFLPAEDLKVAPGARVHVVYELSDFLRLPAQVYYDEQPLARLTK